MGKFDDLKKQISEAEVQAAARKKAQEEQIREIQESQARPEAMRQERLTPLTERVVRPAFRDMVGELQLADVAMVDTHDRANIEKVFPHGGKAVNTGWRLAEVSFKRPPNSSPHNVKCAFIATLDYNISLSLFVGKQTSPSGVQFDGDAALVIPTAREFGPAQIPEIRAKVDNALVAGMKQIVAA